jgi:hypothetical protein
MPDWEDFPRAVRYHLLRTFCAEIIADFKDLGKSIRRVVKRDFTDSFYANKEDSFAPYPAHEPPLEWPPTPPSLTSFLSAITTCREFNDIILKEVKFDDRSTHDLLVEQQYANVNDIVRLVDSESNDNGFVVPLGGGGLFAGLFKEPLAYCYLPEVGVYYQVAGAFWKNAEFAKSGFIMMTDILQYSTQRSSQLLLPHLGPWLQHHHEATPWEFGQWKDFPLEYHVYAEDENDEKNGGNRGRRRK